MVERQRKRELLRHLVPLTAALLVLGPPAATAATPAPDRPPSGAASPAPDPYPGSAPRPQAPVRQTPVVTSERPVAAAAASVSLPPPPRAAAPVRHVAKKQPRHAGSRRSHTVRHQPAVPNVVPLMVDVAAGLDRAAETNGGRTAVYAGIALLLCALTAAAGAGVALSAKELW